MLHSSTCVDIGREKICSQLASTLGGHRGWGIPLVLALFSSWTPQELEAEQCWYGVALCPPSSSLPCQSILVLLSFQLLWGAGS